MSQSDFDRDHRIDPLQLDLEVTLQPERFFRWSEEFIKLKAELERLEAKLQKDIRANPENYGLAKVSEAAVDNTVRCNAAYIDLREQVGIAEARVKAMDTKKRMLSELITLHGQQYFAGPSAPRDLAAMFQAQKEAAEEGRNQRILKQSKVRKRKKRRD